MFSFVMMQRKKLSHVGTAAWQIPTVLGEAAVLNHAGSGVWLGGLAFTLMSMQLANVAVWIPIQLSDVAWLLGEPGYDRQNKENKLQDDYQAATPLQARKRRRPTMPKWKCSANGNEEPKARKQTEELCSRPANDHSNTPTSSLDNVWVRFHAMRAHTA
jgi:hypothetical protein